MGYFAKHPRQAGYIPRNLQDIARVACFVASLENRQIVRESDYLTALRLRDLMLQNALFSALSEVELAIMEHPEMGAAELAKSLCCRPENIYQRRQELEEMGFIKTN
jgi:hypothetical protein